MIGLPFAKVPGARLFYTDDGLATPAVLMVHGWACDSNDWAWQIPELQRRFRIIAPDLRGFGRSTALAGEFDPHHFAGDLASLLRQLDCGPVIVIGHSMGAVVAAILAVEYPELVLGMVSVDPSFGVPDNEFAQRLEFCRKVRASDGMSFVADSLRDWAGPGASLGLVTWQVRRAMALPQEVLSESLTNLFCAPDQFNDRSRGAEYLARRSCPVLAVHSTTESAMWESSTFQHSLSRYVGWDGAGHWLQLERPTEFNDLVIGWISGLSENRPDHPTDGQV